MKRHFVILLTLGACLSNCGGGGGGNEKSDTCRSFCDYACQKVSNCHSNVSFDVGACSDGCLNKLDGTETQLQCEQASTTLAALTCAQLDTVLGLRSAAIRSSADLDAYETGTEIATQTK